MDRIITLLATCCIALVIGAGGVWLWDHHADPLGFHVKLLWLNPGWDAPLSLQTEFERATALAEQRQRDITRLSAAGGAALDKAAASYKAAQPVVKRYERIAQDVGVWIPDEATTWEDADAKVVDSLRGH